MTNRKKPRRSEACFCFGKKLLVHWNLHVLLLNRVGHELCLVVDVELTHQVELVCFDGFHAQAQDDGDLLDGIAFSQQFEDLTFPRSKG